LVGKPVVLVTAHRRESFLGGLENICRAIARLADRFVDHHFVFAVHLNPEVQRVTGEILSGRSNVHLLAPLAYPEFVWLMDRSTLILTDSGGIQEEAPSLGKPVLVLRDRTERPELIAAGAGRLVGTSTESICREVAVLLTAPAARAAMQVDGNPYGDGRAAERIVELMLRRWHREGN
jgi:UDP-N-acetylglucosamine 2-epimerase (non-hydrolysing)